MTDPSLITRLVQALKGTSRFANAATRIVISSATTREQRPAGGLGTIGAVSGSGQPLEPISMMSLTDSSGDLVCLLDVDGAADGAALS